MSDTAQGPGWWIASDGKWYPPAPEVPAPAAPAPPPPTTQDASPGPGWWKASDGTWYPPQDSPSVRPKTSGLAVAALVLAILLGALGALAAIPMGFVARSQVRKSSGTLKGAGLALAAIIIGFVTIGITAAIIVIAVTNSSSTPANSGIAGGPTLPGLTDSVKAQIVGTGTGNFNVSGVDSVVCNPPDSWRAGATFTCFAYDSTNSEVGEYYGTVEPDSASGDYQWNAHWVPSN